MGADAGAGGAGGFQDQPGIGSDSFSIDRSEGANIEGIAQGVRDNLASNPTGPQGPTDSRRAGDVANQLNGGNEAGLPGVTINIGAPPTVSGGAFAPIRNNGGNRDGANPTPTPAQSASRPSRPAQAEQRAATPTGGRQLSRPRPVATLLTLAPAETTRKTLLGI